MIFPLLLLSLVSDIVVGEVITLRKGKNIICVLTEDGSLSGVYLTPNSTKKLLPENWNYISWDHNDWIKGHSQRSHLFKPVIDIRWNDLPENDRLDLSFRTNVSLSACCFKASIKLRGRVINLDSSVRKYLINLRLPFTKPVEDICSWVHFTLWTRNNKLLVTSENNTRTLVSIGRSIDTMLEFEKPLSYLLLVKNHSYNFFWSDIPSVKIKPSSFKVQSSGSRNICLNLFVSIDEGCQLDIVLASPKANLTEPIQGFNKPGELKIWQNRKITFNFSGTGKIYLYRKTTMQNVRFWAIDRIRYCNENNAVLFKTTLDTNNETARCQQIQKEEEYESTWLGENIKAGCLGNKCEITCGGILGNTYKDCQEHTICSNVQEECLDGSYKSDSYHQENISMNGILPKYGRFAIIVLLVMIPLLICICGYYTYIHYNKRRSREDSPVAFEGQSIAIPKDFDDYVKMSLADNNLVDQFESLSNDSSKKYKSAKSPKNIKRNYDAINITYDETRVLLPGLNDVDTDYINASYINGYGNSKAYIVTQGPKESTMADFWRMVWQHDVKIFVMATQFRENIERKCCVYFPTYPGANLPVKEFSIELKKEESTEFYQKRTLEIHNKSDQKNKTIAHYQLNWSPECGEPLYAKHLVPLVTIMNANDSKREGSPIVVHCDLGVQKSAILILAELAVEMSTKAGYVEVFHLAKTLRQQRPNMITSAEEYILAHFVISECLMDLDDSCVPLRKNLGTPTIEKQLEYLNSCQYHDNMVCDTTFSAVESYGKEATYITSRQPQKDEIQTFWQRVLQEKITTIIFLDKCHLELWPFETQLSHSTISAVDSSPNGEGINRSSYVKHQVLLKQRDKRTNSLHEEKIQFYKLLEWKSVESTQSSMKTFIQFVKDCGNIHPTPQKIMICCSDGITGCGLFLATALIIGKYIKEHRYDIFNAVRSIKRTNSQFISKVEELRFLYKMIYVHSPEKCTNEGIDDISIL